MSAGWLSTGGGWSIVWLDSFWRASWQGGLFVLAVWGVGRLVPRLPAATRCWLWWLACLKLLAGLVCATSLALPVLPAPREAAIPPQPAPASVARAALPSIALDELPADASADGAPFQPAADRARLTPGRTHARPAPVRRVDLKERLLGVWLVGLALGLWRTGRQWRVVRRLLRAARPVEQPWVREAAHGLAAAMGLRRVPALLEAPAASGPLVAGPFRAVVVLPVTAAEQLSPGELRMALAHELAHVRRRDLRWGWVPDLARLLFFFNPLAWLACREWETAREAACDAEALRATDAPPAAYGRLLLKLAAAGRRDPLGAAPALGATAGFYALQGRLRLLRLHALHPSRPARLGMRLAMTLAGLLLLPWRLTSAELRDPPSQPHRLGSPPAALAAVVPVASEAAAHDDTVTVCTRQLQVIGEALAAYQRDHGDLPPHLSDLVPRYIADKKLLHCPADPSPGKPSVGGKGWPEMKPPADPTLPISYSYQMGPDPNPRGIFLGPLPAGGAATWRALRMAQRVNYGDRVPVVRCWHHWYTRVAHGQPIVLNLTPSGQVYRSTWNWEHDRETIPVVLDRLERDVDAGAQTFRHQWLPQRIAGYFPYARARAGREPPAPREQCRRVAEKLTALARTESRPFAGQVLSAAGSLYDSAGDAASAVSRLEAALPLGCEDWGTTYRLAIHYLYDEEPQPEKAIPLLERARARWAINPAVSDSEAVTRLLSEAYGRIGRHDRAAALLRGLIARDPKNAFLKDMLARAYEDAGQYDAAIQVLQRLAAGRKGWWDTHYMERLATTYERAGRRDQAEAVRQEIDPTLKRIDHLAPDFSLRDAAGQTVRLADLRGKVVLLCFSASWCPPCRAEAPRLEALYRKYSDHGLVILSINNEREHQAVIDFARKMFTFPLLLDAGEVYSRYGVHGMPCTFLIDRDGKVVSRQTGYQPGTEQEIEKEVSRLLGAQTASRQGTGETRRKEGPVMQVRHRRAAVVSLVATIAAPSVGAPAAPRDVAGQCTRQLQAIGRALAAYRRDHGELPPQLSDLYPGYLTDRKRLHCPADPSPGEPGLEGKVPAPIAPPSDSRLPISYSYTMSTVIPHATFGTPSLGPSRGPWSWRAQMLEQREWYGEWVPVVRCWHHVAVDRVYRETGVLNLTLSGQVYRSTGAWNRYPAAVAAALSHLEKELTGGPEAFHRRWSAKWDEINDWITMAFSGQHPTPPLRDRYRRVAGKLAVLDNPGAAGASSALRQALGTLYTAAGDREKAVAAYERALQAGGDSRQVASSVRQIYFDAGQPGKAITFLERMAARTPLNAAVLGELAYACERAGQRERAAGWRRKFEAGAQPVGQPAPDFTLRDTARQAVRLSDLRGTVVFLTFGASWCGPCRAEAPHLEALYRKYRDQGLVVLGLNREVEHAAEVSFAQKTFTYPLLLDAGTVFQQYGIDGLPTTFVIDRDGKIAGRHVGFAPGGEKQFEEEIRKLLAPRTTSRQ